MLMIQLASIYIHLYTAPSSCFIQMSELQENDHGRNLLIMTVSIMQAFNVHACMSATCRVASWRVMLISAPLPEVAVCYHKCVTFKCQSLCDASSNEIQLTHVFVLGAPHYNCFTRVNQLHRSGARRQRHAEFWQQLPNATHGQLIAEVCSWQQALVSWACLSMATSSCSAFVTLTSKACCSNTMILAAKGLLSSVTQVC
jgi:hypothetical protein